MKIQDISVEGKLIILRIANNHSKGDWKSLIHLIMS